MGGLAMLAVQTSEEEKKENNMQQNENNKKHKTQDSESDDEVIPALSHLDNQEEDGAAAGIVSYIYEEKSYHFDTKPMGFQIEAENGKISVRSVRAMSVAGQYGVREKWDIVAVNGFRDWSSMLGILESSLGPFNIIFAVPTTTIRSLEKSLSVTNEEHPIPPPPQQIKTPIVIQPDDDDDDNEMKQEEYNQNKKNFDMMQRNSSAIAKQ